MSDTATPAYARVADELRRAILTGDLTPGARLIESDLTEHFEVSRSTVREAIRALSSQHLVETVRGAAGGTFVATPDPGDLSSALETNLELLALTEQVSVGALLETREVLEVPAARLAAKRGGPNVAQTFEVWLGEPGRLTKQERFEANRQFHLAVVQASGNLLLEALTRPLWVVLRERFLRDEAPRRFWDDVHRDHRAIAAAISDGDEAAAAAEMHDHLIRLRSTYETIDRKRTRS